MPIRNDSPRSTWRHWILQHRISELDDARCDAANDRRRRAIMCLEDGDLDMAERFCIYAELALTKHRRLAA
jgi:hypothetical protein